MPLPPSPIGLLNQEMSNIKAMICKWDKEDLHEAGWKNLPVTLENIILQSNGRFFFKLDIVSMVIWQKKPFLIEELYFIDYWYIQHMEMHIYIFILIFWRGCGW